MNNVVAVHCVRNNSMDKLDLKRIITGYKKDISGRLIKNFNLPIQPSDTIEDWNTVLDELLKELLEWC